MFPSNTDEFLHRVNGFIGTVNHFAAATEMLIHSFTTILDELHIVSIERDDAMHHVCVAHGELKRIKEDLKCFKDALCKGKDSIIKTHSDAWKEIIAHAVDGQRDRDEWNMRRLSQLWMKRTESIDLTNLWKKRALKHSKEISNLRAAIRAKRSQRERHECAEEMNEQLLAVLWEWKEQYYTVLDQLMSYRLAFGFQCDEDEQDSTSIDTMGHHLDQQHQQQHHHHHHHQCPDSPIYGPDYVEESPILFDVRRIPSSLEE